MAGSHDEPPFNPRSAVPFGRFMLGGPRALALDRLLVRTTGWSVISTQAALLRRSRYAPTLLLTTIGARTGRLRDAALPYLRIGGDLVVVGSNAGGPRDPDWCTNLRRDARCWATVRRERTPSVARIAEGADREMLLHEIARKRPIVLDYESRARGFDRQMPIVRLAVGAPGAAWTAAGQLVTDPPDME